MRRARREGESWLKRLTSALFYRLMKAMSEVDIPLDVGDFRLMDRRVLEAINQMPERNRFVRGMVAWVGFRQCFVEYDRPARAAGETKYGFFKLLRLSVDAIFSYTLIPLRHPGHAVQPD